MRAGGTRHVGMGWEGRLLRDTRSEVGDLVVRWRFFFSRHEGCVVKKNLVTTAENIANIAQ